MEYIIFGAGNNAAKLIERLIANEFKVHCIVDNDEKKWKSQISGFIVKPASQLPVSKRCDYHILISVCDRELYRQITGQLTGMGFIEGTDFSDGLELFGIDEMPWVNVSGYIDLPENLVSVKTFDAASRLIKLKDGRRIFRFVNKKYSAKYSEVYQICANNNLFGRYIVNTEIGIDKWGLPFGLILEHQYIEPVTYCFEWAPEMFGDYVKFMINMVNRFAECGLALCDGHALNATISNGSFIFIDFGALQPGVTSGKVLIEFINTHIIPLILMLKNQIAKAYLYLKNPGIQYTAADIQGYLEDKELSDLRALYELSARVKERGDISCFMSMTLDFINNLNRHKSKTRWAGYQNDEWEWSSDVSKWSVKMHNVVEMIGKVQPRTLIDLAGNMGWYGSCLHEKLQYSIIADYDYSGLDYLWKRIQVQKIPNVVPVYMSICAPALDYYRDDEIGSTAIEPWRKSAVARFKSDLVIALAVVHHLAFAQQLTFSEIVNQIALFSNRYLIVEFVEQSDRYITGFLKAGFEWYTKENFVIELEKRFKIMETRPSTPEETRMLYLCELR